MKNRILFSLFALFGITTSYAQDILPSEVPSLIINNFQKSYPRAYDVEWEKKGELYKVEFENGKAGYDIDIFYDQTGKITAKKEEISKKDLPQNILSKVNAEFSGYRVEDVKKHTNGSKVTYSMELKSMTQEWKVVIDSAGTILSKYLD